MKSVFVFIVALIAGAVGHQQYIKHFAETPVTVKTVYVQTPSTVVAPSPAPVLVTQPAPPPTPVVQPVEKPAGIDAAPKEDTTYQVVYRDSVPAHMEKTTVISKLTNQPELRRVDAVYTVQFKGVQTGTTYPRVSISEKAYNSLRPMMIVDRAALNSMLR